MNIDDIKNHTTKRFWIRCFCLLIVFIAGVLFTILVFQPFWLNILEDKIIFATQELTKEETEILTKLIAQNKIHVAEFAFERIIGFYEQLITWTIGTFAVFGILGYLYIKNSHIRDIEDALFSFCSSKTGTQVLQENARKYFLQAFKKSLTEGALNDLSANVAQNMEDINKLSKDMDVLMERLSNLEENMEKSNFLTYEELGINENMEEGITNTSEDYIKEIVEEKIQKEEIALEVDTNCENEDILNKQNEQATLKNNTEETSGDNSK